MKRIEKRTKVRGFLNRQQIFSTSKVRSLGIGIQFEYKSVPIPSERTLEAFLVFYLDFFFKKIFCNSELLCKNRVSL